MDAHVVEMIGGPNDGGKLTLPVDVETFGIPVDIPASKLALWEARAGTSSPITAASILQEAKVFDIYTWDPDREAMIYSGRKTESESES